VTFGTIDQGRANRFLIGGGGGGGGVVQNLGPLPFQGPLKKFFPESKNFSRKAYHKIISVFDFSTYATYITNITRTFFFVKARKQEIT
jgi:hypothetical protein